MLKEMIANGTITVEELSNAPELIERAKFVNEALKACTKTLLFPMGATEIRCYDYTDRAGEYSAWGKVDRNGIFTCWCNWGGNHQNGSVDLCNPAKVFIALDDDEFGYDLKRFLTEQIEKAKK